MNDLSPPDTGLYAVLEPVAESRSHLRRNKRSRRFHQAIGGTVLLLLLVAAPVVATATYLFAFAADRFESQAVFVVRNPDRLDADRLANDDQGSGDMLSPAGLPMASDDAFAVKEFILSRDAMRLAGERIDLRKLLAGPADDVLWHFPSLFGNGSEEALYRTYLRHVDVHYDFNTNISTLSVQAFSPGDAQRLATVLLSLSEDLVNKLNERGQQDAMRSAADDVAQARQSAHAAIDRMMAFRVHEKVVDPSGSAKVLSKVLVTLLGELIDTRAQIDIIRNTAPRSPQLVPLDAKAASIQRQIDTEKASIGNGSTALAPQIAEYERLALDQEFTSRALLAALAAQERAREDAERKHVYLDRIATPAAPDEARYPWRGVDLFAVSAAAFLLLLLFMPYTRGKALRSFR